MMDNHDDDDDDDDDEDGGGDDFKLCSDTKPDFNQPVLDLSKNS